ncbi:MAG: DUF1292 domain-containing protein [Oscillospiraceae bacterium]|nr:DUF1292 domain-containing protein [Oscillospiraceae bacterium]
MDEYNPEIIAIQDEDGKEYLFEVLDRLERDEGTFVAITPADDDDESDEGEFIVLEVNEEKDDIYVSQIENEELLEELGNLFEERLALMFAEEEEI